MCQDLARKLWQIGNTDHWSPPTCLDISMLVSLDFYHKKQPKWNLHLQVSTLKTPTMQKKKKKNTFSWQTLSLCFCVDLFRQSSFPYPQTAAGTPLHCSVKCRDSWTFSAAITFIAQQPTSVQRSQDSVAEGTVNMSEREGHQARTAPTVPGIHFKEY